MQRKIFILVWGLFISGFSGFCAQNDSVNNISKHKFEIINGDTCYVSDVPPVYIYSPDEIKDKKEIQKYQKLVRNVKKVYPYALLASQKLSKINDDLSKLSTQKEKKEYLDSAEKKLRDEFEEPLKNLTITQGRILIKLIDRETGNTTYSHVKELRGSFSAFFWQSLARLFGSNLKVKYDPLGDDKDIEDIITKIQRGLI